MAEELLTLMEAVRISLHTASLFTSYRHALRRKDWFLGAGATLVVILAYHVSEMTTLLHARELAFHLDIQPLHWYEARNSSCLDSSGGRLCPACRDAKYKTLGNEQDYLCRIKHNTAPTEYWRNHCLSEDLVEALPLEINCRNGWSSWLGSALRTQ